LNKIQKNLNLKIISIIDLQHQ